MKLDPRTHAVRRDLADIRLADRVFAPHYAAPLGAVTLQPTPLLEAPDHGAATLADLPAGTPFDVLDLAGPYAWGISQERDAGLVGYVAAAMLSHHRAG